MPYTIAAIVLPLEQALFVKFLQNTSKEKYGDNEALDYPPHITLKSLGHVEADELEEIYSGVRKVAEATKPFDIRVDGVRFYGTNKSIGVYLNVYGDELKSIHLNVVRELKEFEDRPREYKELMKYNPHFTLIDSSIGKEKYELAKAEIISSNWSPKFSFKAKELWALVKADDAEEYVLSKRFGFG